MTGKHHVGDSLIRKIALEMADLHVGLCEYKDMHAIHVGGQIQFSLGLNQSISMVKHTQY